MVEILLRHSGPILSVNDETVTSQYKKQDVVLTSLYGVFLDTLVGSFGSLYFWQSFIGNHKKVQYRGPSSITQSCKSGSAYKIRMLPVILPLPKNTKNVPVIK